MPELTFTSHVVVVAVSVMVCGRPSFWLLSKHP